MTVVFYSFSKRINSTARPSGGVSVNCNLKSPCSTTHPTIELQFTGGTEPSAWNMCYISEFGRYYYISEWVYNETVWTAHCDVDPLASWKDDIGVQSCYVLRSSAEYNEFIPDKMYPFTSDLNISSSPVLSRLAYQTTAGGTYVVGVCDSGNDASGGATYYALTLTQAKDLAQRLYGFNAADFFYDPLQYIVSFKWFPFAISGAGQTTFDLGFALTGFSGDLISLSKTIVTRTDELRLPAHPSQSTRGKYLNFYPYTRYTLHCFPYGVINLDASIYGYSKTVSVTEKIDVKTGYSILRLSPQLSTTTEAESYEEFSAEVAADLPLSKEKYNPMKAVLSTGALIGAAASGMVGIAETSAAASIMSTRASNLMSNTQAYSSDWRKGLWMSSLADATRARGGVNAIGGIASAVGSLLESFQHGVEINGHPGSFCISGEQATLTSIFIMPVDEANDEYGRPLCEMKVLNTIPGFIKCANSDISIAASSEEISSVKSFLDAGFFYE